MSVNRSEFVSILVFATHIAKIDGFLKNSEKKLLIQLAQEASLTDEEMSAAHDADSLESSIKSIQSNDSKTLLINILYLVASADGEFDRDENAFILKVIQRLELDENQFPYFQPGGNPERASIEEKTMAVIRELQP